jgi:hypothetical protein
MGVQNLLSRAPLCFERHVKPLAPAALAVISTHQCALARVVGYGPFSLFVIHKKGLCPSSGDIKRLMMKYYMQLRYKCNTEFYCISGCLLFILWIIFLWNSHILPKWLAFENFPFLRRVDYKQAAGLKNYCRTLITTWNTCTGKKMMNTLWEIL